jgi:hypothetical protein
MQKEEHRRKLRSRSFGKIEMDRRAWLLDNSYESGTEENRCV